MVQMELPAQQASRGAGERVPAEPSGSQLASPASGAAPATPVGQRVRSPRAEKRDHSEETSMTMALWSAPLTGTTWKLFTLTPRMKAWSIRNSRGDEA